MARALPPNASVAQNGEGEKLFAPAAARNAQDLLRLLQDHAPHAGLALEIASGTGQHITTFAAALPDLHWQPSEVDPARRSSINAHVAEAGLSNVVPALALDALQPGWGSAQHPKDLILLINLLHLISTKETLTLLREVSLALHPGGSFILYGPFKRNGILTSVGDQKFDAQLRAADPAIGYKDDLDMRRALGDAGLTQITCIEMPANNLAFIARKPDP